MQRGVHCRLMDNSTSVREAAVELLGRFVLSRPELIEQYYDMLIERILVIYFKVFFLTFNLIYCLQIWPKSAVRSFSVSLEPINSDKFGIKKFTQSTKVQLRLNVPSFHTAT